MLEAQLIISSMLEHDSPKESMSNQNFTQLTFPTKTKVSINNIG